MESDWSGCQILVDEQCNLIKSGKNIFSLKMQPFTHITFYRVQSREEMKSQGQTAVKNRLSPQLSPTMLSDKQSIQEVTHESPPHNSHVATLKLRGPPILAWKVYKHYIGKRLKKRKKSKEMSFGDNNLK